MVVVGVDDLIVVVVVLVVVVVVLVVVGGLHNDGGFESMHLVLEGDVLPPQYHP